MREKTKIFSKLGAYLIKLRGKENKSQLLASRDREQKRVADCPRKT